MEETKALQAIELQVLVFILKIGTGTFWWAFKLSFWVAHEKYETSPTHPTKAGRDLGQQGPVQVHLQEG